MIKFDRTLSDEEEKILGNDLLDIVAWINGAIDGKINNCMKRAAREYRELLKKEGAIQGPVSDEAAVKDYFKRPDYKDRKGKDEVLKTLKTK